MKRILTISGLILVALMIGTSAIGADKGEWRMIVLGSGLQYHDGSTSGTSGFPIPSGFAEQGLVQAQGGDIRFRMDGASELSGTTGFFTLAEDLFIELISGHQVRGFRWTPDTSGATVFYQIEGRQ